MDARTSGKWGRLKDMNIDPLESIGLPSKGDDRHDHGYPELPKPELIKGQASGFRGSRVVLSSDNGEISKLGGSKWWT